MLAVCAKWEVHGTAIGEVTDTGAHARAARRARSSATCRSPRSSTTARSTTSRPQRPAAPLYPAPAADARPPTPASRDALLALLASPNIASRRPLFEQYDWLVQSRTVRRPEEADAAVLALPDGSALGVSIDGNGRRVAADPYRGTIARRARVRGEPRLRRRRAAGHDEQPQLRQPREAAHRLAADRGRARPGRRVPRARRPDRRRQRLALQRGRRRPDLPDARRRHGRPAARRAPRRPRWASRRRATRSASPGRSAPSLAASELAKLRGEPLPDGLPEIDLPSGPRRPGGDPRGGPRGRRCSSAHDVAEGGLLVAVAECCLAGGVGATLDLGPGPATTPWEPLRRGPGRLRRLGPAGRARRPRWRSTSSAPSAATRSR